MIHPPRLTALLLATTVLALLAACGDGSRMPDQGAPAADTAAAAAPVTDTVTDTPTDTEVSETSPPSTPSGAGRAPDEAPPPDTTASGLWTHLQSTGYRDSWWLWPGTEPYYRGSDPHGTLLTTYTNFMARDGITNGAIGLSPGAVVLKENHAPDSTLSAITVMYKAEGYAPEHGDWFWARYAPDGTPEASGRVESCIGCHEGAVHDYIMTVELGTREALGLEEPGSR